MNCIFFIDTLFAKDKSTVENKCAQIFIDGVFVQIIPMKYKSEASTTLDRINQNVGGTKTHLCTMHPSRLAITHK